MPPSIDVLTSLSAPAWPTALMALKSPLPSPNVMVPKQRRETSRPVLPSDSYLMLFWISTIIVAGDTARSRDFSIPLKRDVATTREVDGYPVLVDSSSITDLSTASRLVLPFCEPDFPRSNSIQPSLKPSSIRMRGTGFFVPCDLKSASHDFLGTTSMRTGLPRSFVRVVAI